MIFYKNNTTTKLVISYLLAILLSIISFVLFYQQLTRFTKVANESPDRNEQVFLISETITDLYEFESLGRNYIKSRDSIDFKAYQLKIDKINFSIDKLVKKYPDSSQRIQINSIKDLLRRKNNNIKELTEIYDKKNSQGFFDAAVKELKKIDPTFTNYKYENRFKNLERHQRKYLIKLLEYSKADNEKKLTNKTVDSIAESVTKVLFKLAKKERNIQLSIEAKEQEIIEDDRVLTLQMRTMLTDLEREELKLSASRVLESKKILSKTYNIILFSTVLTLLMSFTFLYFINKDIKTNNTHRLQLEKSNAYTEKVLKSKEGLMNMVTHDIRAPLHTILGYLELLKNSTVEEKGKHYISQAQNSSDYMLHLVNDLLDFSKMEAGKLSVDSVNFQPNLVVENALKEAIPSGNPKGINITHTVDPQLKGLFVSDPYRIKQIAINLISNAYKFTEEGFININASLLNEKDKISLKLVVSDSGSGISKEKQRHIFEAFSQVKGESSNSYGGFGLGLYITKSLVDLLKGKIQVSSEIGKGSSFECILPLEESSASSFSEIKLVPIPSKSLVDIHAVLVDDDPAQLVFLEEVFESYKIKCNTFTDASKAIEHIKTTLPDIILTDIQMPVMDGFEFLKAIKAVDEINSIPVIALTGNTEWSLESYMEKGFAKRFIKPYQPAEVVSAINDLLGVTFETEDTNEKTDRELKTAHYDLTDLVAFVAHDMKSVEKVLMTFQKSTGSHLVLWEEAITNKDSEKLIHLAHKMHPMFIQIKAAEVYENLRYIELQKEPLSEAVLKRCSEATVSIKETMKSLESFMMPVN